MASGLTVEHLASSPVFAGLPTRALEELAARMQRRTYKRGQVIFHQGDAGATLYVIEEGCVKVLLLSDDGEELLLRIMGAGEMFGELALLGSRPRSATVAALEDIVTYVLDRETFLDCLRRQPELVPLILRALTDLIYQLTEQVEDLAMLDVPRRLDRKLLALADQYGRATSDGILIDLHLTQGDLASMIGASRMSVNQCLASLERRSIISRRGPQIVLRRPDVLRPGV